MPTINSTGTTAIGHTSALVSYTVLVPGLYDIDAIGAAGGSYGCGGSGSASAEVSGDVMLTFVAGKGQDADPTTTYVASDGGGSFVAAPGTMPLVVAGGGGDDGKSGARGLSATGCRSRAGTGGVGGLSEALGGGLSSCHYINGDGSLDTSTNQALVGDAQGGNGLVVIMPRRQQ